MMVRNSLGAADAAELVALVASLIGDERDAPALLGCLAACGLTGTPAHAAASTVPAIALAPSAGDEPQRILRDRLRRCVPLTGAIIQALVQQPQFCLPMGGLADLLSGRRASSAGGLDGHVRAVVGWGVCAGLFFHDAANDVVHLGLFDQ